MFIIEGTDETGKTTLANKIVDYVNKELWRSKIRAYYRHMSKPPANWDYFHDVLRNMNPGVVQDRFHLGGLVWGKLVHGHRYTPEKFHLLEAHLDLIGAYRIVMVCEHSLLRKRLSSCKEQMFNPEIVVKGNVEFGDIAKGQHITARGDMYSPRVDRLFVATEECPYVTDQMVGVMAYEWVRKLETARDHCPSYMKHLFDGVFTS